MAAASEVSDLILDALETDKKYDFTAKNFGFLKATGNLIGTNDLWIGCHTLF